MRVGRGLAVCWAQSLEDKDKKEMGVEGREIKRLKVRMCAPAQKLPNLWTRNPQGFQVN
jgi:hypothetical protein